MYNNWLSKSPDLSIDLNLDKGCEMVILSDKLAINIRNISMVNFNYSGDWFINATI